MSNRGDNSANSQRSGWSENLTYETHMNFDSGMLYDNKLIIMLNAMLLYHNGIVELDILIEIKSTYLEICVIYMLKYKCWSSGLKLKQSLYVKAAVCTQYINVEKYIDYQTIRNCYNRCPDAMSFAEYCYIFILQTRVPMKAIFLIMIRRHNLPLGPSL